MRTAVTAAGSMQQTLSRRVFLAATGGAFLSPSALWTADENRVPAELDHLLLGIGDLDRGIAFVEEKTGVRAMFGGVHPGRGTRNALLALGAQSYLEIFAPDPQQGAPKAHPEIVGMREPRLIGWAVHTSDIAARAKKVADAGFAINGPVDGSRVRPDGRTLRWKMANLAEDRHGLLPFWIEWSADSPHPSADAPKGCRLVRFAAAAPDPDELARAYRKLGLDVAVERADKPQLRARIAGPKGEAELSS